MMKKKTATPFIFRPITLEWVTRHFFLYEDGKMIYARDGASVKPDDMVLLCNNIADCDIDRVTASELGKKKSHVANSFYITVPRDDDTDFAKRHKNRTLLVTHGPEDFKKWIMAFRRLKATVNVEVEEEMTTSPQAANVMVEREESLISTEVSSNNAVEVSALFMSDAKFEDSAVFDTKDLGEDDNVDKLETVDDDDHNDDGEQSVHFSDYVDVISIPGSDKEERSVGKVLKSVSFDQESMGDVIPDVDQMSEISGDGDSEKILISSFSEVKKKVVETEHLEKKVSFRTVKELIDSDQVIPDDLLSQVSDVSVDSEKRGSVSFSEVKMKISGNEVIDDVETASTGLDKKVSFRTVKELIESDQVIPDADRLNQANDQLSQVSGISGDSEKRGSVSFSEVKMQIAETEVIDDVEPPIGLEKKVSFRSVTVSIDSDEVIPDIDQLSETSGESEKKVAFRSVMQSIDSDQLSQLSETSGDSENKGKVSLSEANMKITDTEAVIGLEKRVSFRTVKESIDSAEVLGETITLEKQVSFKMEKEEEMLEEKISPTAGDPQDSIVHNAETAAAYECCKGAKIFAHGDTLDELAKALTTKLVLYGIVVTSLEDTMDDETFANSLPQQSSSKFKAFSLEFMGDEADGLRAEKFEQHLSEIISFCKLQSSMNDLHPIRCGNGEKARDEIVSVLQVIEAGSEDEGEQEVDSSSSGVKNFEYDSSSGLTAYKYALKTQDSTDIPNGPQVLECVRQQMGVPYNWVLFQPSQTELIVEDAGSGGVIEMTEVLHESYNDRVLFGLARVSFMGNQENVRRRQIWFALEWKGEYCTSVKMIRQCRDSATKMNEFIGERSFTMTNVLAADMTPDSVCAWAKKSCVVNDFTLSVDSMNSAHLEEQKVIKEYYEKLAMKEAAIKSAKEVRRKEQIRNQRLLSRREARENTESRRRERKERWSKLSVPEILKELGNIESLPGWVLLEMDV